MTLSPGLLDPETLHSEIIDQRLQQVLNKVAKANYKEQQIFCNILAFFSNAAGLWEEDETRKKCLQLQIYF